MNVCDPDTARYTINTNLSARVSMLNPAWNDDVSDAGVNDRFKVRQHAPRGVECAGVQRERQAALTLALMLLVHRVSVCLWMCVRTSRKPCS